MLIGFEVGLVSRDARLVDFFAEVFLLERLAPAEYPSGTLHRLGTPGAVIKVMVPTEAPAERAAQPFLAVTGLRYLTMSVDDLDDVIARCGKCGGRVMHEPFEFEPGKRIAVIADPDGNAIEVLQLAVPTQ
jgi:predicted enzyme related to lactoylglutathione lyase